MAHHQPRIVKVFPVNPWPSFVLGASVTLASYAILVPWLWTDSSIKTEESNPVPLQKVDEEKKPDAWSDNAWSDDAWYHAKVAATVVLPSVAGYMAGRTLYMSEWKIANPHIAPHLKTDWILVPLMILLPP